MHRAHTIKAGPASVHHVSVESCIVPALVGAQAIILDSASRDKMIKMRGKGASLVAQGLRVCLPVQGTRVRALVWEDPTCRGATGPVNHNY